jgi:hypothetical protein
LRCQERQARSNPLADAAAQKAIAKADKAAAKVEAKPKKKTGAKPAKEGE